MIATGSSLRLRMSRAGSPVVAVILAACFPAYAMSSKAAPPLPPPGGPVVNVSTIEALRAAIATDPGSAGVTIMLADGTYNANAQQLYVRYPNMTIRGASGDPAKVILRGKGFSSWNWNDNIILIGGAAENILIADVTITECFLYGVQVKAEDSVKEIHFYNCRFLDIGTRLLKGSHNGSSARAVGGSVRYCHFENTLIPGSNWQFGGDYISSLDMMALVDWEISDNFFKNIKGYSGGGRAAIFLWRSCSNVTVQRNVIIDCDRGIAFGNPSESSVYSIIDSVIYNNFIVPGPDAGIELWFADNIKVYNNTIWRQPEDIAMRGIRGGSDTRPLVNIDITNNIIRGARQLVGTITERTNYTGTVTDYFVSAATGDLRLTVDAVNVIDAGTQLSAPSDDYDGYYRDTNPDIGASEYGGVPPSDDFGSGSGCLPSPDGASPQWVLVAVLALLAMFERYLPTTH